MRLFGRLRTQLILSHLTAIAFTLVAMVAAVVLIAGSWFARQQGGWSEPTRQARLVAEVVSPLVASSGDSAELNVVLRAIARGDLAVPYGPPWAPEAAPAAAQSANRLTDVAYIVVVGPDGRPLASSDPAGAGFTPPERGRWDTLAKAALVSNPDPRQLVWTSSGGQPAALGAYPVIDDLGHPSAVVLIATRAAPTPAMTFDFWHGLAIISAASAAVLALASLFALIAASVVSYFLSRRLVTRLERLGRGAEALAAGDLTGRVDEGPGDEVGQLARRFNLMAERLAATVAELASARDHAESALRAKRDLVANVSHELRTPLALIRSHVEALQLQRTGPGD
ncbi:MAG TPA: HAMP domain-containing protein, partial [Chloroflexota bacterium]|nr:HAMP domain-containing protein [Chloroflexota bacterium]